MPDFDDRLDTKHRTQQRSPFANSTAFDYIVQVLEQRKHAQTGQDGAGDRDNLCQILSGSSVPTLQTGTP